jgi:hypothetical protein
VRSAMSDWSGVWAAGSAAPSWSRRTPSSTAGTPRASSALLPARCRSTRR